MTCKCPWLVPPKLEPETVIRKADEGCGQHHDKRELPYSQWQLGTTYGQERSRPA